MLDAAHLPFVLTLPATAHLNLIHQNLLTPINISSPSLYCTRQIQFQTNYHRSNVYAVTVSG